MTGVPATATLPKMEAVIRGFTPNWFAATMGTGILALMLPHLPLRPAAGLGEALWGLNILLFLIFTVLSVIRLIRYPQDSRATLHHPVQSMFLGAVPMGLATIVNGLVVFGVPHWGEAAAQLARDLWLVDAVMAAGVGVLVPYLMFTRQEHALDRMTAVWLLPVVASEVAAASAGLIAPHLSVSAAVPLVYSGYVLFALSVPLALMLISLLVLRLAQHKLPSADLAISMFLPLGPLATGAQALLQLGAASPRVLSAQGLAELAPTFTGVGLVGGLMLWGFGAWWLLLATLTTLRFTRTGLPFNLGWWGLTFPLGVYTAATFALSALTHLLFFERLGQLFVVVLAVLWTLVVTCTCRGAWTGDLFGLPSRVANTETHSVK